LKTQYHVTGEPMTANVTRYPLIAFDCGNGFCKLCETNGVHSFPSFVSRITDINRHQNEGVFTYQSGNSLHLSPDIAGTYSWQFGSTSKYSRNAMRVGNFPANQGKVKLGLQLLLGAIPKQDAVISNLVVTCPDVLLLGDQLKQAYEGTHTVNYQRRTLSGCENLTYTVTIERCLVQPESYGGIADAIAQGLVKPSNNLIGAIDLGFTTAILSVYDSQGNELPDLRVVTESGCSSLYQAIASRSDFIQDVADNPQIDLIERGITEGTFFYGGEKIPFERFFRSEFPSWSMRWWEPFQSVLSENRTRISDIVLLGGGANLAQKLVEISPKIKLTTSPQLSAVKGIYDLVHSHLFPGIAA
jgi:hypothetical protein